jgi:3-hydroxyacyl-[acyl-carrier-protein] dehydratase
MDIHAILKTLPHRYPFLLVDRVLECVPGESLTALKNVTINEPFFPGHFPNRPVMPGVLILEALAQATGLLAFATADDSADDHGLYYFAGIDGVRFRKPVEAGDQLILEVRLLRIRRGIGKFAARALVDGEVVCEGELMCAEREFTR